MMFAKKIERKSKRKTLPIPLHRSNNNSLCEGGESTSLEHFTHRPKKKIRNLTPTHPRTFKKMCYLMTYESTHQLYGLIRTRVCVCAFHTCTIRKLKLKQIIKKKKLWIQNVNKITSRTPHEMNMIPSVRSSMYCAYMKTHRVQAKILLSIAPPNNNKSISL